MVTGPGPLTGCTSGIDRCSRLSTDIAANDDFSISPSSVATTSTLAESGTVQSTSPKVVLASAARTSTSTSAALRSSISLATLMLGSGAGRARCQRGSRQDGQAGRLHQERDVTSTTVDVVDLLAAVAPQLDDQLVGGKRLGGRGLGAKPRRGREPNAKAGSRTPRPRAEAASRSREPNPPAGAHRGRSPRRLTDPSTGCGSANGASRSAVT